MPCLGQKSKMNADTGDYLMDARAEILKEAIQKGTPQFLLLILADRKVKAVLNQRLYDHKNKTALMIAARGYSSDDATKVEILLAHGADPNIPTPRGPTLLQDAVLNNQFFMASLLVRHGANVNVVDSDTDTPLIVAAYKSNYLMLRALLDSRTANVNYTSRFNGTALHTAVRRGHYRMVDELIRRGADVNLQSSEGDTAIMTAAADGVSEKLVYRILEEPNCDLLAINKFGQNVLQCACSSWTNWDIECVIEHLIKRGADINHLDHRQASVLLYAVRSLRANLVMLMLKAHCNVDSLMWYRDCSFSSALKSCVQKRAYTIVFMLYRAGAAVPQEVLDYFNDMEMIPDRRLRHEGLYRKICYCLFTKPESSSRFCFQVRSLSVWVRKVILKSLGQKHSVADLSKEKPLPKDLANFLQYEEFDYMDDD